MISDELRTICGRLLTLSFICLALKFLPVDFVSSSGIRINLANRDIVVGAFASVTFALSIATVPLIFRDALTSIVMDRRSSAVKTPKTEQFDVNRQLSFLERNAAIIAAVSTLSFWVQSAIPPAFGLLTSLISYPDMVLFWESITT